ncbi:MAG: hypothetical protein GXP49_15595 [Deltaproteobacteria bacterium]|nr:hypothetical protein [Deltaproteobacteria bacterium]
MSKAGEVPSQAVEEILQDMAADLNFLRRFLVWKEKGGQRLVLLDPTVDKLEEARDVVRGELAKVENFIQNIPEDGNKTYAIKARRMHESRLFDIQDLLERLESYTFEDL